MIGHIRSFLRLVAFEHSVFALPFAYLASLTAMHGAADGATGWVQWDVLLLVTVAMVAGRTFAMAANRIIDRHVDAQNPRTAQRELVTGAVSLRVAYVGSIVSLVFFFGSAALLNPLCLALSPLAVIPLIVYPYGKRFTDFPHAILGLAQMVAPIGAWLAVTGTFEGSLPAMVLGLALGCGSVDSTLYTPARTSKPTGVSAYGRSRRVSGSRGLHTSTAVHTVCVGLFVYFDCPWASVGCTSSVWH